MLAFNQQRFVADAAHSLLAQDYSPLEIVLSDHGSTDGTREILAGIARDYRGPHRVKLNRSQSAGGILGHFLDAVAVSSGELIVMAGGDDISLPSRVASLVRRWRESGAAFVCSDLELIDASGKRLMRASGGNLYHDAASYFPAGAVRHLNGAAAAYERLALTALARPPFPVFTEDLFLALMLGQRSAHCAWIDEPLVRYRIHDGAYTSRVGSAPSEAAAEAAMADRSRQTAQIFAYVERAAQDGSGFARAFGSQAQIDLDRLAADRRFHEAVAGWGEASLFRRLAALSHAKRAGQRRWMLPRLLGFGWLGRLKRIRRAARKIRR